VSRLQSVINTRPIFSSSEFQHITPLLRQLHWLKAPEWIAFKQAVLVYKCLHGSVLPYLTDELSTLSGCRCRGSSATLFQFLLIIDCQPHPTSYCGDRAFPVTSARVWNSLPDPVTSAPSVAVFRSRLKTHLFNISYPCDCSVPAQ